MGGYPIKIGVAAVLYKGGKILLGKRLNSAGAGSWGLQGGHLEFGESIQAGLERELMEEIGITVNDLKLINITNDPREDGHYIHFAFSGKGIKGEPEIKEPNKCEELKWFASADLPENIFFGHKKLLKAVLKNKFFEDDHT